MASQTTTTTTAATTTWLRQHGLPYLGHHSSSNNKYTGTAKWLVGVGGLVIGMIHVGGLTRLTHSGLSMTDWSPLGRLPPRNATEWQSEFARYQQFPEYQQRQTMTMSEFQYIYAWEYAHRMLGRLVGVAFAVPWLYLTLRRKIPSGYQPRMAALLGMGGAQGAVGWWMVQSGLDDDRRNDRREIRVRPGRLAAHLSMAVATYGVLVWTALDIFSLPHNTGLRQHLQSLRGTAALQQTRRLRIGSLALTGLTFVTITSGALVAGNDAGRAYNTFPTMNGEWIPTEYWNKALQTRNLVENTATVQFNHRALGTATGISALGLAAAGLCYPPARRQLILTPQVYHGLVAVGAAASAQWALGVTTLLTYVPMELAALHQLGSVVVFTSSLYLSHALRYARPALMLRLGSGSSASSIGSRASNAASR